MNCPTTIKPRFVEVPISRTHSYECGALLLSYLCFPEPGADVERARAFATVCYLALKAMAEKDKTWISREQILKPGYLMYPKELRNKYIPLMERKIHQRIAAASVAAPLLYEGAAEFLGSSQLTKSKRTSIVEGLEQLIPSMGISDVVNVSSRIWRPSLPVIHLTMATVVTIHASSPRGTFFDVFCDEQFIRSVVGSAETFAFMVSITPKLKKNSEALIEFGLV